MGCDIHIFVERRRGDKWETVSGKDPMQDWYKKQYKKATNIESIKFYRERYEKSMNPCYKNWICDTRNYRLFSLLANVRNGISIRFGEISTGHRLVPISDPKGLPEDVTDIVKEEYEMWGCDSHSASYLTLKELIDGTKNKKIFYRYLVSKEEYVQYKTGGHPESWCGGSNAKLITNEEMDRWIAGEIQFGENEFIHTILEWEEDLGETGIFHIIKELEDLLENPENVRIVFWFDN